MKRVLNMKELQWSLEWTDPQKIVASLQIYELCQKKYTNGVWGQKKITPLPVVTNFNFASWL